MAFISNPFIPAASADTLPDDFLSLLLSLEPMSCCICCMAAILEDIFVFSERLLAFLVVVTLLEMKVVML